MEAEAMQPLDVPATLADSTADAIRERILAGGFAPGERLVEASIARQLGVSRGPVREALAKLRAEGLVRDEPRRGSFVAELTAADVREIYQLRAAIEARAARLILERRDEVALVHLARVVDEMRAAAAADDRERFADLDLALHEELTRVSGNSRLHSVFVQQAGLLRALLRLEMSTQYPSLAGILAEHEQLLVDLRSNDIARAESACELHLRQALERVLRMLE